MKKDSKKALLASTASLTICAALFAGTTFAWFTDSASSGISQITSGNLDVNLYVKNGDSYEAVTSQSDLFSGVLWEPGAVQTVYLKIANEGSLALKYKLQLPVTSTIGKTADDADIDLTQYLQLAVIAHGEQETPFATRSDAITAAKTGTTIDQSPNDAYSGILEAGTSQYVAVVLYMPETVGNEANYGPDAGDMPSISMGVTVIAGQQTSESDSYGSDYDKDAPYAVVPVTSQADLLEKAANLKEDEILMLQNNIELTDITLPDGATIDGGGNTVTIVSNGITSITGKVTLKNVVIESKGAWGLFAKEASFDNVTFNGADPYIDPTADVIVTNCTFNGHSLQLAYEETSSTEAVEIKTVITGNTFIVNNGDDEAYSKSHAIVFNTCKNLESNTTFWNNITDYVTVTGNTFIPQNKDKSYLAYFLICNSLTLTDQAAYHFTDNTYQGEAYFALNSLDEANAVKVITD